MQKLVDGIHRFQEEIFSMQQGRFQSLVENIHAVGIGRGRISRPHHMQIAKPIAPARFAFHQVVRRNAETGQQVAMLGRKLR